MTSLDNQIEELIKERNAFEAEVIALKAQALTLNKNISTLKRSNRYIRKQSKRIQGELEEANREATVLAMFLYNTYYKSPDSVFELCDTPAGIITQIDNMVAGMGNNENTKT